MVVVEVLFLDGFFSPLRMRMLAKKAYETFLGDHGARSKSSFSTVTGRASGLKVLVLSLVCFCFWLELGMFD